RGWTPLAASGKRESGRGRQHLAGGGDVRKRPSRSDRLSGVGPAITSGREPKRAKHEPDDETDEKNAGPDGQGPGRIGPEGSGGHGGRRRGEGPDERTQTAVRSGDRPRGGGSGRCGNVAGSDHRRFQRGDETGRRDDRQGFGQIDGRSQSAG